MRLLIPGVVGFVVILALLLVLSGDSVVPVKPNMSSSSGLCREGFVVQKLSCDGGNESFDCSVCVRNESFECTGRITQSDVKGFPVSLCGRSGIVSFEQRVLFKVDELVGRNATVRFKGVATEVYQPCEVQAKMPVAPQSACGSVDTEFYVDSLEEVV
ncbi:Uncharacterised protein [uncultured archaeon]|nr:Uncharacterised protein [uncultured archaeon]